MKQPISILECTIRDGSYLIDYQFTAEDTYIISAGLERAGFKFIEIGHGTGLRSSLAGMGAAAASDEEYLEAARTALSGSQAKFGMFFIPGIGKIEDLDMAARYGMGFVRIGTNVTEIDQAKPYIEQAKSLDMVVASNLMKSYAVTIEEFVKLAKKADEFGVDIITIVDSAGGMFPDEVREYVLRLKDVTDKKIGYHGHNNLQLAVANTLEAIRCGATIVDSSLQGMGRSAGNTQTEILIMVLEKLGYDTGIDPFMAMDLGERVIKPMMNRDQGVDDMSVIAGIAQFHSSFSKIIDDAAKKFKIDPRMLIMEVSEINRITVTNELAEQTAEKIRERHARKAGAKGSSIITSFLKPNRSSEAIEQARSVVSQIVSRSKKTGKESVFSLTLSKDGKAVFPFIRESAGMVIGNCEASRFEQLTEIISVIDGQVDWVLLDQSCPRLREAALENLIQKSRVTWYSEERALRLAVCTLLSQKYPTGKVLLFCDSEDAPLILLSLRQQGLETIDPATLLTETDVSHSIPQVWNEINAVISFGKDYTRDLEAKHADLLSSSTHIYAARASAYANPFWEAAMTKGFPMYRVDSRSGFAAELSLVVETRKLVESMGTSRISGFVVVSGGAIAPRGTVIVDAIDRATQVIGIADGLGGLLAEEMSEFQDAFENVKAGIIKKQYRKEF
jgi:4-hydroxy-2-oxovalerate aldolase